MKKFLGITFGSLQKKLVVLVVAILALAVAVFMGISVYKDSMLVKVVEDTRVEQEQAISEISDATMDQVLDSALVSSTQLRAQIADSDFSEIVNNVYMLQTMAQGLFGSNTGLSRAAVSPPDKANDGKASAMVLCEEGVDYTKSRSIGIAGHMSSPMIAMQQNSDKIDSCYIGLEDGTFLLVDEKAGNKFDEDGKVLSFNFRERPWYLGAAETGKLYFTGILEDVFSGMLMVTCSAPVEADGKLVGVVAIDIILDSMDSLVSTSSDVGVSIYVVNDKGQVTLANNQEGVFDAHLSEDSQDLRNSDNAQLASFIKSAYEKTTDLSEIAIGDKTYYMVGSPIPTIGWTMLCVIDREVTDKPTQQLLAEYDEINKTASERFRTGNSKVNKTTFWIVITGFILGLLAAMRSAKRVVSPIEEMTKDVVKGGETGQLFEMKDCYRTDDEIEVLALAFDDLSKKTRKYIDEVTEITREKERVSTELAMATQIQESMLPSIFPAFPERPEFDIYASMHPAREVGGDFYDFFLIDDNHLCMVMADVSGKGIPAALFMMASKIIIQSCAMLGRSAAEILNKTNEAICSNNQMEMFVTTWVGILELSTGKLTAANAGHEYPALCRKDGKFELYKDKHGFVIGGLDYIKYHEYNLQLNPGDRLFLYTDGVPEATDVNSELFGSDRMLDALNAVSDPDPEAVLNSVKNAVDDFVKDAEQFDDLTMLCLVYNGTQPQA